ncbi:MAG: dynein regulation protein LC7 [Corynebacteriales bacterium]|nr:dynein regulation protein LC7 [Mycobacteriales bacterium]
MTAPVSRLSADAENFNWLLSRFSVDTAGVTSAIAVSADGLLIASSSEMKRDEADRLSAITSAINSLALGASRCYDLGSPDKVIIDFDRGYVLVSAISVGSCLGVLASKEADLGNIAYEMALFANRTGAALTPTLIDELKSNLAM